MALCKTNVHLMNISRQVLQQLGPPGCNPSRNRSCQEILSISSLGLLPDTGSYNGSLVKVYCDMEGTHCINIMGWTRVAYVNMTQPNVSCPHGLKLQNFPSAAAGLSLCGSGSSGCQSELFPTIGLNYSQVCGQLIGYQFGATGGFKRFNGASIIIIIWEPSEAHMDLHSWN